MHSVLPAPLLDITRVSAGYGSLTVLRDVSIGIRPGTVVGIIGPNGHGKTTLMNAISGFVRLSKGNIRLDGQRIDGLPPHRIAAGGIAHIPQGDLVFPDLTVSENLSMGAYLERSADRRRERLDYVYSIFPKLEQRSNQCASSLSGGERRMLAIGRGLMGDSRLLLVDEPSLGLAPIIIEQIYAALRELKKSGRTILIVEENPARFTDLADEVHLLDNGTVVWRGHPSELEHNEALLQTYLGA